MSSNIMLQNRVVYLITVFQKHHNQRVKHILSLRRHFEKLVLVSKAGNNIESKYLPIGVYPNPTGVLRLLNLRKIKKSIDRYLFFPDRLNLYVWKAQNRLKKIIAGDLRAGRKITIINCLPPHALALLGLFLKREFPEIRWIVDWQDLWSHDETYLRRTPTIYRTKLAKVEKNIISECDLNITTNRRAKDVLERRFGLAPGRVISINHAFDPLDLPHDSEFGNNPAFRKRDEKIKIGFLGHLFKGPKVPGHPILQAVADIRGPGMDVELHIYGDESETAKKAAKEFKNDGIIFHEKTMHRESLRRVAQCDFLLLALSNLPYCNAIMHSKLPHYLMLGKPIIAVVPEESAVADIIKETGSGYVIPAGSDWPNELKEVLQSHGRGSHSIQRNHKAIELYSWENISKYWMDCILGEPYASENHTGRVG